MTLKELMDYANSEEGKAQGRTCEASYRRGVHQSLHAFMEFMEDHPLVSPREAIGEWVEMAYQFRDDGKDHPIMLHEMEEAIEERMKLAKAKPNEAALTKIMAKHPELHLYGYQPPNPDKTPEQQQAEFDEYRAKLLNSVQLFEKCCHWVEANLRPIKSLNWDTSSYYLKHIAERSVGEYVPSGVLIAAMFHVGFGYAENRGHAVFNVSQRSINLADKKSQRK